MNILCPVLNHRKALGCFMVRKPSSCNQSLGFRFDRDWFISRPGMFPLLLGKVSLATGL